MRSCHLHAAEPAAFDPVQGAGQYVCPRLGDSVCKVALTSQEIPKTKGLDFMKAEHKLHTMTDPKMFCACMQSDSLEVWVSSFLLCVIG